MRISESITDALFNLLLNRTRSFLTILGIIFGVAAVIAMFSVTEGAKRETLNFINEMGKNNITITNSEFSDKNERNKMRLSSRGLTMNDTYTIKDIFPNLHIGSAVTIGLNGTIPKNMNEDIGVLGVDDSFWRLSQYHLQKGRWFSKIEQYDNAQVCVLGSEAARALFAFENPLHQDIKINNLWFRVIGVMKPKPAAKNPELSLTHINDNIYIPLFTAIKKFGKNPFFPQLSLIRIQAPHEENLSHYKDVLSRLMKRLHRNTEDFSLTIAEELIEQEQKTLGVFHIVMGSIAAISLLVGGIGIMNIMLANVIERKKEIGIRRAVGATQKDILQQFLVESVCMSFIGGMIGIIFGIIIAAGISWYAGWPIAVSWYFVIVSAFISVSIGVIFGLSPAKSAAKLHPIECLTSV